MFSRAKTHLRRGGRSLEFSHHKRNAEREAGRVGAELRDVVATEVPAPANTILQATSATIVTTAL